jgi:3-oxoacyl-[acyl-carrier protein] reductase
MTRHDGKVALVTGGSRGIGFAIADALAKAGMAVAITGRTAHDLEAARARLGGRTIAIAADVGNPADAAGAVTRTVEALGGLDLLVNNAGVGLFSSIAETTVEDWQQVIGTNLSGVFYCCRAAIPHLRTRGGGWIINISSLASKNPFASGAAYSASKAALNAFSEALMQELRYDRIRVSYILPGSVSTGFGGRGDRGSAEWKIGADDVARVVVDLLEMPERSLPSRIELRPSRPVKSG